MPNGKEAVGFKGLGIEEKFLFLYSETVDLKDGMKKLNRAVWSVGLLIFSALVGIFLKG